MTEAEIDPVIGVGQLVLFIVLVESRRRVAVDGVESKPHQYFLFPLPPIYWTLVLVSGYICMILTSNGL